MSAFPKNTKFMHWMIVALNSYLQEDYCDVQLNKFPESFANDDLLAQFKSGKAHEHN